MENKTNIDSRSYSGSVPMVKIDGSKVRKLREEKKLTQLYLSTVVGVTTDTISRWENKHYQSIKLENAQKLAEALEVPFEELLKQVEELETDAEITASPAVNDSTTPPLAPGSKTIFVVTSLLVAVFLAGVVLYQRLSKPVQQSVSATRVLPSHVAPGQTFPVLIQVSSAQQDPVSLIIKEVIPPGTISTKGLPAVTSFDSKDNSLKWIQRLDTDKSVYAYLCNVPINAADNSLLVFDGAVTLKQDVKGKKTIEGDKTLRVAPYHWADLNKDYQIDDEEILAVYDTYSDIDELAFDRELIDSIWASSGYRWDIEKENFVTED